ncbi:MAG TPA: sigma-70 family RNA polymerase sigma factor [Sphingobacteriaceae bacterium]
MQQFSDIELIGQVLGGNEGAYAALVRRHQRYVFTLALRFTRNRENAEEIAQDVFVKAYRSLHTFRRTSRFSTWLYSIAYTTAMTSLRKNRIGTVPMDDETLPADLAEPESDLRADGIEQKSRDEYLNLAIGGLMPDDAVIITLFYKGEQSLEEIAATLGIESNAVKVRLYRARQRLKGRLEMLLQQEVKELL